MSQQEMEYNIPREDPDPAYGSYGAVPPQPQQTQQPYSVGIGVYNQPIGQKIGPMDSRPTAAQRLALAIVSIISFFGLFIVSLVAAAGFSDRGSFVEFILLLGLIFSFVVVIVINALYNRR